MGKKKKKEQTQPVRRIASHGKPEIKHAPSIPSPSFPRPPRFHHTSQQANVDISSIRPDSIRPTRPTQRIKRNSEGKNKGTRRLSETAGLSFGFEKAEDVVDFDCWCENG